MHKFRDRVEAYAKCSLSQAERLRALNVFCLPVFWFVAKFFKPPDMVVTEVVMVVKVVIEVVKVQNLHDTNPTKKK